MSTPTLCPPVKDAAFRAGRLTPGGRAVSDWMLVAKAFEKGLCSKCRSRRVSMLWPPIGTGDGEYSSTSCTASTHTHTHHTHHSNSVGSSVGSRRGYKCSKLRIHACCMEGWIGTAAGVIHHTHLE